MSKSGQPPIIKKYMSKKLRAREDVAEEPLHNLPDLARLEARVIIIEQNQREIIRHQQEMKRQLDAYFEYVGYQPPPPPPPQ